MKPAKVPLKDWLEHAKKANEDESFQKSRDRVLRGIYTSAHTHTRFLSFSFFGGGGVGVMLG